MNFKYVGTHLVCITAHQKQIERYGRHQIYEKPAAQIMDRYTAWMGDNFILSINKRSAKID